MPHHHPTTMVVRILSSRSLPSTWVILLPCLVIFGQLVKLSPFFWTTAWNQPRSLPPTFNLHSNIPFYGAPTNLHRVHHCISLRLYHAPSVPTPFSLIHLTCYTTHTKKLLDGAGLRPLSILLTPKVYGCVMRE